MVIELLLMIFLIEAGLKAFGFYLTYFNDRCVNSARSVVRAGSGSQARGGRAAPIGVHAPFCPLLTAGGRSVNLNAAASASPGRRLLPVLSVRSPRSTYQRRRSRANLCIRRLSARCLGPRTVPNAERSTRCPGANLEADRST